MYVYLEINIANVHREILSTPECPTGASICTFHLQLPFCVYGRPNFVSKVSSDDDDLRALVEDSRLYCLVVDMHVDFSER